MTQYTIDEERPWLGGACVGGDDATYFPHLWRWLVEQQGVRSVLDVGCGEGHALNFFRDLGCRVVGVDGIAQGDPDIVVHDFTTGDTRFVLRVDDLDRPSGGWKLDHFDLCWSCEFVEHVEERYLPNFLATFACAETVLMTHAFPGQAGWHHVNCQEADYWKGALAAIGYQYDDVLTVATRELARSNTDPNNHFVRSGLAFKRYE